MPFVLTPKCPCCRDMLHHCERCWDKFHNGEKHKDYEPPEYYGQSMISEEVKIELIKLGVYREPSIKPDKERKYKEGEYH